MEQGIPQSMQTTEDSWTVQAGSDGRWRAVSGMYRERGEALERLEWFRVHAPRSVSYRLARVTTTVTTTVETV
ncbi:hypothetical protein [Kitasatospora herbaricolor]|uniref:hypothetical protein n=1 Tax=Kitasatospora herbaricolor TaxID=68217 RepID=UPI0036DCAD10